MYTVEKNTPIPARTISGLKKYDFESLEVGHCMYFKDRDSALKAKEAARKKYYRGDTPVVMSLVIQCEDGFRIWRLA